MRGEMKKKVAPHFSLHAGRSWLRYVLGNFSRCVVILANLRKDFTTTSIPFTRYSNDYVHLCICMIIIDEITYIFPIQLDTYQTGEIPHHFACF